MVDSTLLLYSSNDIYTLNYTSYKPDQPLMLVLHSA